MEVDVLMTMLKRTLIEAYMEALEKIIDRCDTAPETVELSEVKSAIVLMYEGLKDQERRLKELETHAEMEKQT